MLNSGASAILPATCQLPTWLLPKKQKSICPECECLRNLDTRLMIKGSRLVCFTCEKGPSFIVAQRKVPAPSQSQVCTGPGAGRLHQSQKLAQSAKRATGSSSREPKLSTSVLGVHSGPGGRGLTDPLSWGGGEAKGRATFEL